jgi:hypothetical protein
MTWKSDLEGNRFDMEYPPLLRLAWPDGTVRYLILIELALI